MAEEITIEEAEARRALQGGRVNTPERKAARIRAREAAERAASDARRLEGVTLTPAANGPSFPLATVERSRPWPARIWRAILRWLRK